MLTIIRSLNVHLLAMCWLALSSQALAQPPGGQPWEAMDYGATIGGTFEAPQPEGSIAHKGLLVRLDRDGQVNVVFDKDLLQYTAGWSGGLINWRNVVYNGEHQQHPRIVGRQIFGNPPTPGWADADGGFSDPRELPYGPLPHGRARWKGLYRHGEQAILAYTVLGTDVLELPGVSQRDTLTAITRTIEVGPSERELIVHVASSEGERPRRIVADDATAPPDRSAAGVLVALGDPAQLEPTQEGETAPPPAEGLIAHWKFDERMGEVAGNAAGEDLSGDIYGGAWADGRDGGALRLDGSTRVDIEPADDAEASEYVDLGASDFTFSAWVRTASGGTIFAKAPKTGKWAVGGKSLFIRDGRLVFDVGWVGAVSGQREINDGQWHHVAVRFNHQTKSVRLFVDGKQDGQGRLEEMGPDPMSFILRLGYTATDFPNPSGLEGLIDDVRLYSRSLPAMQIARLAGVSYPASLVVVACDSPPKGATWQIDDRRHVRLRLPPASASRRFRLVIVRCGEAELPLLVAAVTRPAPLEDPSALTTGGPALYPEVLHTQGELGTEDGPYAVDTLMAPHDNPWRSWMRFGGFDFFPGGQRAAICTWNGDVWLVDGIDDALADLRWRRIATGMFQPLGLKIVEGQIYVCCRDQITRLHDLNGDQYIDFYENFNNDHQVTSHFHEFAMDLQTQADGDFLYAKSARHALDSVVPQHGTLMRVSRDGSTSEIVANGFRAANGVGVGPQGELVTSDQEGHWVPANRINMLKPGGFYGNMYSYHRGERPTSYDPPLMWLPKDTDNSPAEQLWVNSDRWGPFNGQLLSTSYGTGQLFLIMTDIVAGQYQGAAAPFPFEFPTGVMRGRFNQRDGQLYVCGLFGWGSRKTNGGGFYRVRYTGAPVHMPQAFRAVQNGVAITFAEPLEAETAQQPGSYSVETWNYRWTANYGSDHYRPSDPDQNGQDRITVASATLMPDGKTVFLQLDPMQPVMQMKVQYALATADGAPLRGSMHATIHNLRSERIEPQRIITADQPGQLTPEVQVSLQPGLLAHFTRRGSQPASDVRVSRMAALSVPPGTAPSAFLPPGEFDSSFTGYLYTQLRGGYTFSLEGTGEARLAINGHEVLSGSGELGALAPVTVALNTGHNSVEFTYSSVPDEAARVRVLWESDQFPREPLPPTALFHKSDDAALVAAESLRQGRHLFATHHCARCHASPAELRESTRPMPELEETPPRLDAAGSRLTAEWMYRWLLDPHAMRPDARMPRLLSAASAEDRQQAADVVAYLAQKTDSPLITAPRNETSPELVAQGEILYEDLGCIACHSHAPPETSDEFDRVTLHHVTAKFQPGALAAYLRDPRRHAPFARMPDFQLPGNEATALAAYLRERSATSPAAGPKDAPPHGDADRGEKLYDTLGCRQCHAVTAESQPAPPYLGEVFSKVAVSGCLASAGEQQGDAPHFAFTAGERQSLAAFLATGGSALAHHSSIESTERQMTALNCAACHRRDSRQPQWPAILAAEGTQGLPPEITPELTWIGDKLRTAWTEKFFAGKLSDRPRPWLKARMPVFPARAELLAEGLAAQHGQPTTAESAAVDISLAEIGQRLTMKNVGFDCRQCHALDGQQPEAAFDSRGVDLATVTSRLRHDYYHRWMLDAPRLDPGTKMPRFAPNLENTAKLDVMDGNARRQFEAIWAYLQSIEPQPN